MDFEAYPTKEAELDYDVDDYDEEKEEQKRERFYASVRAGCYVTYDLAHRVSHYIFLFILWNILAAFLTAIFTRPIIWKGVMFGFIGAALMPISSGQRQLIYQATTLGNQIQDQFNTVSSFVSRILNCLQGVIDVYNTIMRLVASILKRIFNEIASALNVDPIFTWADRSKLVHLERELRKLHNEEERRWYLEHNEKEIWGRMHSIPPDQRIGYMRSRHIQMERKIRNVRFDPPTFIPEILCDILNSIIDFLLGFLSILRTITLGFLDFLFTYFNPADGEFGQSLVEIIVNFLIGTLLANFPPTQCFVNLDNLKVTPVDQYPALFASQAPQHIIGCLCLFRYESWLNGFNGDEVPSNIGNAIVGCFCPLLGSELYTTTNPKDLLFGCLGLPRIESDIRGLINTLEGTFKTSLGIAQSAIRTLAGQFASLQREFTEFTRRLNDLLPRNDLNMEHRFANLTMSPLVFEREIFPSEDVNVRIRNIEKYYEGKTKLGRGFTFTETMENIEIGVREMERQAKVKREEKTIGQEWAEHIQKMSNDSRAKQLYMNFTNSFPVEHREHAGVFVRENLNLLEVIRWALFNNPKTPELDKKVAEWDFGSLYRSTKILADSIERRDGVDPVLRNIEVAAKTVVTSFLNPSKLPLVTKMLHKRYGNESMTVEGLKIANNNFPKLFTNLRSAGYDVQHIIDLTEETKARTRLLKHQNKIKKSKVFDYERAIEHEFSIVMDSATHLYRHFEPIRSPRNVFVLTVSVFGGGATAFASISGFIIGAGASAASTIFISVIAPFFSILVTNFVPVISHLVEIVGGLIFNVFSKGTAQPPRFDWFSPIIAIALSIVSDSYTEGYQIDTLNTLIEETVDITLDNIQYEICQTIRGTACLFPFPLPPYSCPQEPTLDEDGRPNMDVGQYIEQVFIYYPQDAYCGDSNDCGGGDCVSPERPSRLCTNEVTCFPQILCPDTGEYVNCIPNPYECDASATIQCIAPDCNDFVTTILCYQNNLGQCNGWPLIREGISFPSLQLDLQINPQCEIQYGIDIDGLDYQSGPVFKEYGFTPQWFFSWEFLGFYRAILASAYNGPFKMLTRAIFHGGSVAWVGIFSFISRFLWFIPGWFAYMSPLTFAINNFTPTLNAIADTSVDILEYINGIPLISYVSTELLTWIRYPNYGPGNKLGTPDSFVNILLCALFAIPPTLVGIGSLEILIPFFLVFVASGGLVWCFFFFVDVILIPFTFGWYFIHLFILGIQLHRERIMDLRDPTEPAPERRATLRYGLENVKSMGKLSVRKRGKGTPKHNVVPSHRAVHIGNGLVAMHHRPVAALPPRDYTSSFALAVLTTFGAVPYMFTPAMISIMKKWHIFKRNGKKKGPVKLAFYDHLVPHEAYEAFPYASVLCNMNGVPLLEDPFVIVADHAIVNQWLEDEHVAVYQKL
jgi:hypothetical protein